MIFFFFFLSFVIFQRIIELLIARKNEEILLNQGAYEIDKKGYKYIVLTHVFFFISLIIEKIYYKSCQDSVSFFFLSIFIIAQFLRYWSIVSLGVYWNTKIIILKGSQKVNTGPYRYFKHPNYIAVIIEIAVIPLIFACYFTTVIFSILNIFILIRRINIEQEALKSLN